MKIIALRGEPNCGKTTTLGIVYGKMLNEGFLQVGGMYQNLGNNDFLDVLEYNGKKIGIVSQGDYARSCKGSVSVQKHLENLRCLGANIVLCACTTGTTKNRIQNAIDSYQGQYVDKQKSTPNNYTQANQGSSKVVIDLLMNLL